MKQFNKWLSKRDKSLYESVKNKPLSEVLGQAGANYPMDDIGDAKKALNMQSSQPKRPPLLPQDGDRAYSKYRGIIRDGVLRQNKNARDGIFNLVVEKQPWFTNPDQHLAVGSDEPIKWDAKMNMWYAPADYD